MAPLDSVLDIDGNRHVSDRLRALIESRRTIAFSGAGHRPSCTRSGRSWCNC